MARKKTTVYIEEDLLKAAKIVAARTGKREYQVFEDALRRYDLHNLLNLHNLHDLLPRISHLGHCITSSPAFK